MDIHNPQTWFVLEEHPCFQHSGYCPEWYEGDAKADVRLLRETCILLIRELVGLTSEFRVLDDCTIFATLNRANKKFAEIYPARATDGDSCVFVSLASKPNDEIRVRTAPEVLNVLHDYILGKDLTVYQKLR